MPIGLLAVALVTQSRGPEPLAIVGVRIETGDGPAVERATVLVRDGRIEAVGPDLAVPAWYRRIEGKGKTLVPGFLDAYRTQGLTLPPATPDADGGRDLSLDALPTMRSANRRGIRPDLDAADLLTYSAERAAADRRHGFAAVNFVPGDNLIGGRSALVALVGEPRREAVLSTGFGQSFSFRYDSGGAERGYPGSLLGNIAQIRQALFDARATRRPGADPAMDALADVPGKRIALWEADTQNEIRRARDLSAEGDLWWIPVGARELSLAPDLAEASKTVIVGLDFGPEPKTQPDEPAAAFAERLAKWKDRAANAGRLAALPGRQLAFTLRGTRTPVEFFTNLRAAVANGLPKDRALRMLTAEAADLLQQPDLGRIRVGARADLALFDGDWAAGKEASATVVGGRFYDPATDRPRVNGPRVPREEDLCGCGGDPDHIHDLEADRQEKKAPMVRAAEPAPAPPEETPATPANLQPTETDADRTPATKTGGDVMIVNARLLTVTKGEVRGWLLARKGKIVSMGEGKAEAPAGVTVVDALGRIVTPGLVDAHTHMASDSTNEGAEAITAEVRIRDVLNPAAKGVWQKLAGGTTTSLVLHGSANPIGGESLIVKNRWRATPERMAFEGAPRVIKFALGENVKGERTPPRYPSTRMGVESVYRRAFTEARFYAALRKSGKPYRRDLRLDTLADILEGKVIVHCHAYRGDEMLALVRTCQEFGVKLYAFTHGLEAYKIAPELRKAGVGVSLFADAWAFKFEGFDSTPFTAAMLTRGGVLTSINTDTGGGPTPFQLDAAKSLVYGGLTADEVLRMVTINPARQLGIEGRVGSLEVGKDADLVVWDGHPLSVSGRVKTTILDGEIVFQRKDAFGLDARSTFDATTPVVASGPAPALPADLPREYTIVNARLMGVDGTVTKGAFSVRDGVIVETGSRVKILGRTVDVRGAIVSPGLLDAGSDIGRVEFGQVQQVDDETELGNDNPDLVAYRAVNVESERIPNARLAGVTYSLSRPNTGTVSGQSSLLRFAGRTTEDLAVVRSWGLHVAFPEGAGAFGEFARNFLTPEQLEQARAADRQRLNDLEERFARAKRYDAARAANADVEPDAKLEAMRPFVRGERPVVFRVDGASGIRSAVEFGKRLGLKVVVESGKEAWKVAPFLAKEGVDVLLPLPVWSQPGASGQLNPLKEYDPYDAVLSTPALLERAGVRFAFQSDASENTYNLPYRAGYARAWGLSPARAFRAMTTDAAAILGVGDRLGRLAPGYRATFFLADGDPLSLTTRVGAMVIEGRPVPLSSRWTRLYEKYRPR